VRHVLYTSIINPEPEYPSAVAADHRATEEALLDSGIEWTFLRNSIYAEYQVPVASQAIASGRHVHNSGDGSVSFVSRVDCAAAAAGGSLRRSDGTSQSYGGRCTRARLPWSPVARSTSVAGLAATPSTWRATAGRSRRRPDRARRPGSQVAFPRVKAARRIMLPRGMDREQLVALLGNGWDLQHAQSVVTEDMPPPVRRAEPTLYRLARRTDGGAPAP
jgi:hypothetical protein